MEDNSFFTTSDTSLVSYLVIQGHRIDHIDYSNVRAEFYFPMSETIKAKSVDWSAGNALGDCKDYGEMYRKLARITKNRIQFGEDT